jgi:hypothetical protein
MPTASELLREVAPEAWDRTNMLERRLEELSDVARDAATDLGLWRLTAAEEEVVLLGPPEEVRSVQLRSSGLLGTGVTRLSGNDHFEPVIFVELRAPVLTISQEPGDAIEIERYWRLLENLDIQPGDAVVIGLPAPLAEVGPRDPAFCNGPPGTFGARVTTSNGQRGILTAGHVAPNIPTGAYTNGPSHVGTVTQRHDIVYLPAGHAGIDVAVVELPPFVQDTGSIRPSSMTPRAGQIWDQVIGHGAKSPGAQGMVLSAGKPFAGPSRRHGHWDEALLIQPAISAGGDSGGMVLLANTGELVGHVVGGFPGVYSIAQDAQAQLRSVGGSLR